MTSSAGQLAAVDELDDDPLEGDDAAPVELVETSTPADRPPALALVEALEERAEHNPALVYLAQLAPGSRPAMRAALETIAGLATGGRADVRTLPWAELRYLHLQALRAALAERYAPATVNRHLSAVRGVLREAWRMGAIDGDAYQRARAVEGVRGSRLPAGRDVSMRERQRLFDACAADPIPARGARDAAMLGLLAGTGVRRAEVVALDLEHVREDGAVRVLGKGNKERLVYLVDGARAALELWLGHRGSDSGPLLSRVLRGGHVRLRRLTPQAVHVVIERRILETGVNAATAHDFRRTLCGDLLDAGADLASVQALLGHASPVTTARYDRRGERARRKAAELAKVPFKRAAKKTREHED